MTGNVVGKIDCVLCGHEGDLKEDKNNKPYHTCGNCQMQLFGRGKGAADHLYKRVKKVVENPVDDEVSEDDKEFTCGGLFT